MKLDIISTPELIYKFGKNHSEINNLNMIMDSEIDDFMEQVLLDMINKYQATQCLMLDELDRRDFLKYLQ